MLATLALILFAVTGELRTPVASPEVAPEVVSAFEEGLQELGRLCEDEQWSEAAAELDALLAEHAEATHALLARPRIAPLAETIHFWLQTEPPRFEDLVSGTLVSYSRSSGNVELVYASDELGDFFAVDSIGRASRSVSLQPDELLPGDWILHQAPFAGPHTFEIRGGQNSTVHPVQLYACVRPSTGEHVTLWLGRPGKKDDRARTWGQRARAFYVSLEGSEEVGSGRAYRPGERFDIKVRVSGSSVTLSCDGKKVVRGTKPSDLTGQVGFKNVTAFETLVLKGRLERSWLENKLDAAVQRERGRFLRRFDVNDALPEWLRAREEHWDGLDLGSYPGPRVDGRQALYDRLVRFVRREKDPAPVLEDLPDDQDDPFRLFVISLQHRHRGELDEALEACTRVLETEPESLPVQSLMFDLVLATVGTEVTAVMLEARLNELGGPAAGDGAWIRPRLARLQLLKGDVEAARTALREEVGRAGWTSLWAEVGQTLQSIDEGPAWTTVHEYESRRFVVRSDIDRRTCVAIARRLEAAAEHFEAQLGKAPRDGGQASVYMFSGRAGYEAYLGSLLGTVPESTLGVFSPVAKQLVVWDAPERERVMQTVQHEGLHQYVDRVMPGCPLWLNEGLAEYWGGADLTRSTPAEPVVEHVVRLSRSRGSWMPLVAFVKQPSVVFHARGLDSYAQAWALVHFLLHSTPENRRLFEALVAELRAGRTGAEAVDTAFDGVELERLDGDLRAHVRSLR